MSLTAGDFEVALRAHLNAKFLHQFPPEFLKMRVGEFLELAAVGSEGGKANFGDFGSLETPRTATRRSTRQHGQQPGSAIISSITKSVKRTLFPAAVPLKTPSKVPSTPSAAPTPQLTIKTVQRTAIKPAMSTTSTKRAKVSADKPPESPNTSTGIVQFQLNDGKVIDVDFSRSPKSALQDANLLGTEAIGEVKAKIETYANQFMQYLKFFKKFKPTK